MPQKSNYNWIDTNHSGHYVLKWWYQPTSKFQAIINHWSTVDLIETCPLAITSKLIKNYPNSLSSSEVCYTSQKLLLNYTAQILFGLGVSPCQILILSDTDTTLMITLNCHFLKLLSVSTCTSLCFIAP